MAFIKALRIDVFLGIGVAIAIAVVSFLFTDSFMGIVIPTQAHMVARTAAEAAQQLPGSTSQLPLICFLGAGMIIGGFLSAMRTRPAKQSAS